MYRKIATSLVALVLLAPSIGAGNDRQDLASVAEPTTLYSDDARIRQVALTLPVGAKLRVEALALQGRADLVVLELERFEVFSSDLRIDVNGIPADLVPHNAYYRGIVEGDLDSRAVLSFRERGGAAGIVSSRGQRWVIARDDEKGAFGGRTPDPDERREFVCEPLEFPDHRRENARADAPEPGAAPEARIAAAVISYSARVAVETDYEYTSHFANLYDARDYIGDLFAHASSIYANELNTNLVVNYVGLWTSENDPWNGTTSGELSSKFQDYWNLNRTAVRRSLAHFLSGKQNMGGGAAVTGFLCDEAQAYGVSTGLQFNFDINEPASVWDIVVVTHEIGHNFNSPHSHCYEGIAGVADAVDHCFGVEAGVPGQYGCYSGTPELPCSEGPGNGCGTIMSYCRLLTGELTNIALTLGRNHPHGVAPWRVPDRMLAYVQQQAGAYPGCLSVASSCADTDLDGVCELDDNCPLTANGDQADDDGDGLGDACDPCRGDSSNDRDDDGICGAVDNCSANANPGQDEYDGDGIGDACDNCLFNWNPGQADLDSDDEGDFCDRDDGVIYIRFNQPLYVEWEEELGFSSWNSYRGDLQVLKSQFIYTQDPALVPLAARSCDLATPWVADTDPPAGAAVFFLTTGNFTGTGVESGLGLFGSGWERPNTRPCP